MAACGRHRLLQHLNLFVQFVALFLRLLRGVVRLEVLLLQLDELIANRLQLLFSPFGGNQSFLQLCVCLFELSKPLQVLLPLNCKLVFLLAFQNLLQRQLLLLKAHLRCCKCL